MKLVKRRYSHERQADRDLAVGGCRCLHGGRNLHLRCVGGRTDDLHYEADQWLNRPHSSSLGRG